MIFFARSTYRGPSFCSLLTDHNLVGKPRREVLFLYREPERLDVFSVTLRWVSIFLLRIMMFL